MDTEITSTGALRTLLGMALLGLAAAIAGVAWDARLHAANPDLAVSESIFSPANPGHTLIGIGMVLVATGVAGASWIVWLRNPPQVARAAGALALAVGILAGGGAVVWTGASAHDHGDQFAGAEQQARGHDHIRNYDALWEAASPEERAAATRLVADTKAATLKYADVDEASRAGYRPNRLGPEDATHYPNQSLMRDGKVLDPMAPESLMYWTAPDGDKVLVGVVYKAAPSEHAPAPGGALTAWHTHASGKKCYPGLDADCPHNTTKMLHVFFFDGVDDPFTESMAAAAGGRQKFADAMREWEKGGS